MPQLSVRQLTELRDNPRYPYKVRNLAAKVLDEHKTRVLRDLALRMDVPEVMHGGYDTIRAWELIK